MDSPDYRMSIVDLRIPFVRLVCFFVKATLAMIPAAIILGLIFALLAVVIGMLLNSLGIGNIDVLMRRFTP